MSAEQMDEAIQALREAYGEDFDAAVAGIRADARLGRKVRALLASENAPQGLIDALVDSGAMNCRWGQPWGVAWSWFREQLLGPVEAVPLPPPANIPEAGRGPLLGSLATGGATGGRDGE